jgi:protein associated with RNAse G/E
MATASGLVSDFDFHPDEDYVRQFRIPSRGVLRLDEDAFVSEAESAGIVLRHYAFRDEWFKVNVTIDRTGEVVEPEPSLIGKSFAYNCDIATPMELVAGAVCATDLFVDVLVRQDGVNHEVVDLDEFDQAIADRQISQNEAMHVRSGLARLVALINSGDLYAFLNGVCPFGPSTAESMLPVLRASLDSLPAVQPGRRPTW